MHSSLWLDNIPACGWTFCLSIHLSMDTWVVSTSWQFLITLLWMWVSKCVGISTFNFFFFHIDLKELFVHNTTLYLTFWGTARLFSTAVESRPIADRMGFPGGSVVKNSANPGDVGSIPGLGRSPGEGDGNPLQYSCLGNPVNRGAWRATVHGVPKSQRWVSD